MRLSNTPRFYMKGHCIETSNHSSQGCLCWADDAAGISTGDHPLDQRVVTIQSRSLSINSYPVSSDKQPVLSWVGQRVSAFTWVNSSTERACLLQLLCRMWSFAKLHGCLYSVLTAMHVWLCWVVPLESTCYTTRKCSLEKEITSLLLQTMTSHIWINENLQACFWHTHQRI